LRLTRDDVDLKGETLLVRHGKSRAARRTLWLQASTIEILRPRITRRFVHLFPGGRWEPEDRPFSYSGMVNIHNRVFETLNGAKDEHHLLDGFDLYSLRHTFATRFYQATKDLDKLARILGHANLATVRRYVNPSQQDIRDAMKEFEKASTCKPRAASRPRKPFLHQRPTPDDAL
jgi:integrase